MKRQLLAVAIGSLFALPALANNEIDAGYHPHMSVSNKSVEQVRAELIAAQRAGEVAINAELGYTVKTLQGASKSRADVVAEVAQARRSGNYILNAELGTKASQL
ncbi:MAG: hypothetical protein OEZ09_09595 [Betaproteobacteria bacterium]|nr:hypothetical protein [Betaproteobacteria bacterium]MDH4324653.1 hypothetical protein [Betaproteobacteria bacterium]MDH5212362.1 hypothetical protein [Betaproteobacteria bacterium]MDH5578699.1 hypothetical protein [Betaproteobacteria bacterium]